MTVQPASPGNRNLHILYMIDEMVALTAGGTERQILQMARMMQTSGARVQLCVLRGTEWMRDEGLGIPVYWAGFTSVKHPSGLNALRKLRNWIKRQHFDVVQTFFVESNIIGPVLASFAGIPVILGSRRNLNYWMGSSSARLQRLSNHFATRLVANCEAVKQAVIVSEDADPSKIDVIYNGLDLSSFHRDSAVREQVRRELNIADEQKLIGNVSTLRPVKGTETFLQAAALIHRIRPEARFVLVGNGPLLPALREQVRSLDLENVFHFAGAQLDIARYLQAFDIAVLSSDSEGFSNSILEYMAMGLPVVATDVGGNSEALADTGKLVPAKDASALSAAIIEFLQLPALAQSIGQAAQQRAQEFDIENARRRLLQYYQELLAQ